MRHLYFWPLDPFSRQVRLVLDEKSVRYKSTLVEPWKRPEDLLTLNPAGMTPVLTDNAGGQDRVVIEARAENAASAACPVEEVPQEVPAPEPEGAPPSSRSNARSIGAAAT